MPLFQWQQLDCTSIWWDIYPTGYQLNLNKFMVYDITYSSYDTLYDIGDILWHSVTLSQSLSCFTVTHNADMENNFTGARHVKTTDENKHPCLSWEESQQIWFRMKFSGEDEILERGWLLVHHFREQSYFIQISITERCFATQMTLHPSRDNSQLSHD